MAERKPRCRYLRYSGDQCSKEVMFEGSILLCQHHLWEANAMLMTAGRELIMRMNATRGEGEPLEPKPSFLDPRQHNGVVYYVRFGDRIKIGTTINLASRMTAIPHDEILATEVGGRDIEQRRHRQFGHCRIHGEWFRGDDTKLLAHIAKLSPAKTQWGSSGA